MPTTRIPLPAPIVTKMKHWRNGFGPMPKEYITFHRDLATARLAELEAEGCTVHSRKLENDGWFDGMRSLQAVVETPSGRLLKVKWNDSNQGFLAAPASGGGGWGYISSWA